MSWYGLEPLRGTFDIYVGLHGKSVQFTKGGGDLTTCCQNLYERCSSIENSENSRKRLTVFLCILQINDKNK